MPPVTATGAVLTRVKKMADGVGGVGAKRHFSPEEEEALRKDESTSTIVKKDAKIDCEIWGVEKNFEQTKEHQQNHVDKVVGGLVIGTKLIDMLELVGIIEKALHHAPKVEKVLGPALLPAAAIVGLVAGMHENDEAIVKGQEQNRAIKKDNAHVALVGALDLPDSYRAKRFGDFKHVPRENGTVAFRMTEALRSDKQGLATLQLHADRGMHAARDLMNSKMSVEAFLKANPKVAEAYAKDAAFREGFDAYLHAKANMPSAEFQKFEAKLNERDGWYAQSQIAIRV